MGADTFTVTICGAEYTAPVPSLEEFTRWNRWLRNQYRRVEKTVQRAHEVGADPELSGAIKVGRRLLKALRRVGIDIPEEVGVRIPLHELVAGTERAGTAIANKLGIQ